MTSIFPEDCTALSAVSTYADALEAKRAKTLLCARCVCCDRAHDLWVSLGKLRGRIPREEGALGIDSGEVKEIALLSRVNQHLCFRITGFEKQGDEIVAVGSRRMVQEEYRQELLQTLCPGDILPAVVTHLEPFGVFVDIGAGVVSMIPIDRLSVSRIRHPKERFAVGQKLWVVARGFDEQGRILLSHKELLGSWSENAAAFSPGETVGGVVRSVEPYGIFVELTPNLTGLAELKEGVQAGDQVSVYIKSILPERMKIKLVIISAFREPRALPPLRYFRQEGHLARFRYSPPECDRVVETIFDEA